MADHEVGFIGLGRMGANMVNRMLLSKNIDVHVFNRSKEPVEKAVENGAVGHESVEELVNSLKWERRVIWLMLPAGNITEEHFQKLLTLLKPGDVIIDGANSNFHDTIRRHKEAAEKQIGMLDVGVSGGIIAAEKGYPMMIGGHRDNYNYCKPIFDSFGISEGYDLVGEEGGSGHYVKMIHNAIEYGMMQAIAEGFGLLKEGRFKNLDVGRIAHIWNHGTIIESFLMDMTSKSFHASSNELTGIAPHVDDSGEGRWSAIEAVEYGVPFVVNTYATQARFQSRGNADYANKLLAAIRNQFGGHAITKEEK